MDQRIIYIGNIEEYLKLDKNKSKNPDKYKSFEIIYDLDKMKKEQKEVINVSNNNEKRFNEEEKKVEKYLELHKGENLTYREAVLACLDRSEKIEENQKNKEEFEQYIQKQKEDLKKVEEYIEKHPGTEYQEAVLIVLGKDELTKNEEKVEEYIEKHEGCTYREAVLACLDSSEGEGFAEDQEIINMHTTINDLIYSLSMAEKSSVFKTEDKSKLEQALGLVAEVKESLQKIIDKKGGPEKEE